MKQVKYLVFLGKTSRT